jgi:hypothetical protein
MPNNSERRTPQQVALEIVERNLGNLQWSDRNPSGSYPVKRLRAKKQVIERGPCSTCNGLTANSDTMKIGCRHGETPFDLAVDLISGRRFLPELSCRGHQVIGPENTIKQVRGTVMYHFPGDKSRP